MAVPAAASVWRAARPRAARRRLDGRGRRRGRPAGRRRGERGRHRPRCGPGGAGRVLLHRLRVRRGRSASPYVEVATGRTRCSAYGRTKLHGEGGGAARARGSCAPSWTSSGADAGSNFVRGRCCGSAASRRTRSRVVDDQRRLPHLRQSHHGGDAAGARRAARAPGIWHVAAEGQCTWFEFASAIFEEAGIECRVRPISTAELGRPAPRPAYSVTCAASARARRSCPTGARACGRACHTFVTVSDTGTRPRRTAAVWLPEGAAAVLWRGCHTSVTVSGTGTGPREPG